MSSAERIASLSTATPGSIVDWEESSLVGIVAAHCRVPETKETTDSMEMCVSSKASRDAMSLQTHLLGLSIVVVVVPLLGLVRSRGNLPGRLAELLGCRLRRHRDSLECVC